MDPESKKLLEDSFRLAQENNQMLHSVRRSMRMARIMSILYWVIIIGASIGAFYVLQPYIDQAQKIIKDSSDTISGLKNVLPKQ